jgi:hypothetical protein
MGVHKKKGRLRCHKRPKSREETPKEGSDSGALPHSLATFRRKNEECGCCGRIAQGMENCKVGRI